MARLSLNSIAEEAVDLKRVNSCLLKLVYSSNLLVNLIGLFVHMSCWRVVRTHLVTTECFQNGCYQKGHAFICICCQLKLKSVEKTHASCLPCMLWLPFYFMFNLPGNTELKYLQIVLSLINWQTFFLCFSKGCLISSGKCAFEIYLPMTYETTFSFY